MLAASMEKNIINITYLSIYLLNDGQKKTHVAKNDTIQSPIIISVQIYQTVLKAITHAPNNFILCLQNTNSTGGLVILRQ